MIITLIYIFSCFKNIDFINMLIWSFYSWFSCVQQNLKTRNIFLVIICVDFAFSQNFLGKMKHYGEARPSRLFHCTKSYNRTTIWWNSDSFTRLFFLIYKYETQLFSSCHPEKKIWVYFTEYISQARVPFKSIPRVQIIHTNV